MRFLMSTRSNGVMDVRRPHAASPATPRRPAGPPGNAWRTGRKTALPWAERHETSATSEGTHGIETGGQPACHIIVINYLSANSQRSGPWQPVIHRFVTSKYGRESALYSDRLR